MMAPLRAKRVFSPSSSIDTPVRIFIVDDKELTRSGISMLLENENDIQIVGTAVDGREALFKLRTLPVDIVLMDIEMEPVNGIEAAEKLRLDRPEIKIIMLTDYDEEPLVRRSRKVGAAGYLLKNVSKERLLDTLHRVAEGETCFDTEPSRIGKKPNLPLPDVSDREAEVVRLLAQGMNSHEVAAALFISKNTVDTHRKNLLAKTGAKNVAELIGWAANKGLI
jgi:DNA-binding NarL/FixJ family response regulator